MQLAPFLDHLEGRLGDSLRAVQWYRGEETELIYLREDLDMERVIRRGEEVHQRLSTSSETLGEDLMAELGDQLATISVREGAFLLNFPVGHRAGVIVGIDVDVGTTLHGFIGDAREVLVDVEDAAE